MSKRHITHSVAKLVDEFRLAPGLAQYHWASARLKPTSNLLCHLAPQLFGENENENSQKRFSKHHEEKPEGDKKFIPPPCKPIKTKFNVALATIFYDPFLLPSEFFFLLQSFTAVLKFVFSYNSAMSSSYVLMSSIYFFC